MALHLRIELESDAAPGAGTSAAGYIDRDITASKSGLPIIPARRIKGCLREAATEIAEALEIAGKTKIVTEDRINALFGKTGDALPGALRLDDARLDGAAELEKWLTWAADADEQKELFTPQNVLATYTGLRHQTSIDLRSGGPLTNTLRTTRVIARHHTFIAPVTLSPPLGTDTADVAVLQPILALACLAFRSFGLSRNRGLGDVEVRLLDNGTDVKDAALGWLQEQMREEVVSNG